MMGKLSLLTGFQFEKIVEMRYNIQDIHCICVLERTILEEGDKIAFINGLFKGSKKSQTLNNSVKYSRVQLTH